MGTYKLKYEVNAVSILEEVSEKDVYMGISQYYYRDRPVLAGGLRIDPDAISKVMIDILLMVNRSIYWSVGCYLIRIRKKPYLTDIDGKDEIVITVVEKSPVLGVKSCLNDISS